MKQFVIVMLISIGIATALGLLLKKFGKQALTLRYFKLDEFDSPALANVDTDKKIYTKNNKSYLAGSGAKNMKLKTLYMLDKARHALEKTWNKDNPSDKIVFGINSGYRTQHYNDTLSGSAKNSAHVAGMAADINVKGWSEAKKKAMLKALYEVGFRRFGFMANAIHVDNDESKPTPANWDYDSSSMPIIDPSTLVDN